MRLPALLQRGIRVIDLSADYRLRDPNVYAQWYGESHHDLREPGQGGLRLAGDLRRRDHARPAHRQSGLLSADGILGLAPLVAGKHIDLKSIIIDSKSGVSGAGRTPKLATHFPECNESVSAYSVGQHRHTPEIEQALTDVAGEPVEVIFTPHLIPMDRGIFSHHLRHAAPHVHRGAAAGAVSRLLRARPRSCACVESICRRPRTRADTNFIDMTVRVVRGRIVVLACEDNLIRGASGVAVQNFNRMYGFDEKTGLW